jgi:O-antigen ligase
VTTYAVRRGVDLRRSGAAFVLSAGALVLAGALGLVLAQVPLPAELLAVAALGLLFVAALALVRHDLAVALGFALLGIVLVEPAPADLVFFVAGAVALATGRLQLRRAPGPAIGLIGLLFILNLVSAVEAVDAARAAVFATTTVYVAVLGLWLATWLTSRKRARLAAGGYVLAASTSAAAALLALFFSTPGSELLVLDDRAQGLFKDANVFGPFLVPAALIMIEETLAPRLFRRRWLSALLVVLLGLGVLFSYSRGAWVNMAIGTVVMVVVLALRRRGGRKAVLALVLLALAAASVYATVSATGSGDFLTERAQLQSYDADRFGAQAAGLEPGQRYPFGVGPGQFEYVAPISAHSTYVRVFAEQGLPGLLALIALGLFTLGAAVANAFAGRDTYGIGSAALLGAWCGLLVNSVVIDTLHWRHLWIVAAFVWAGWARRSVARQERSGSSEPSGAARAAGEYVAVRAPVAMTPRRGT